MLMEAKGNSSGLASGTRFWHARYDMLDGWRGLAALSVVVQHVFQIRIGHVAVMLFFVISGYCITASATSCLKKGYGFRQFMWRRIRRIYPPYLLAIGYFVGTRFLKLGLTGANQLVTSPVTWLQNITLTQWFTLIRTNYAYAADNPANFVTAYWSLNYEEQFYLIIALMMVAALSFRWPILRLALPLMGVAFICNLLFSHYSHGFFTDYWLHFGIGLLLFYRLTRIKSRAIRRSFDFGLLALAAVSAWYAWLVDADWYTHRPLAIELFVVATFSLLLVVLRPFNERFSNSMFALPLMKLGAMSYSLYLVHQCNLRFVSGVTSSLLPLTWRWPGMFLQLALHVFLAIPFFLVCERPFHNKSLVGAQSSPDPSDTATSLKEDMRVPLTEVSPSEVLG